MGHRHACSGAPCSFGVWPEHYDARVAIRGLCDGRVIAIALVLDMQEKWMEKPSDPEAYEALEEEFALAAAAMDAKGLRDDCR